MNAIHPGVQSHRTLTVAPSPSDVSETIGPRPVIWIVESPGRCGGVQDRGPCVENGCETSNMTALGLVDLFGKTHVCDVVAGAPCGPSPGVPLLTHHSPYLSADAFATDPSLSTQIDSGVFCDASGVDLHGLRGGVSPILVYCSGDHAS